MSPATPVVPPLALTDCDLHIGRVVPLSGGQLHPVTWDQSGDIVKVSGIVYAAGITDAKTLRAQLSGYVDSADEEVVPVRWDADTTVDGYYRVRSAEVAMHGASLRHGVFDVSVDLERALSYAGPLFESVLIGATLTNGLGQAGNAWHGIPDAVKNYSQTLVTANTTRVGQDGTTRIVFFSGYGVTPRYLLVPASYYVGSSTLSVEDAASVLQVVTGLQCENKPGDWQISNGFLRVRPFDPGAFPGVLAVDIWDGTQWETKLFTFSHATGTLNRFDSIAVLRNSPEEVVVRIYCSTSVGTDEGRITLDLSLRRGAALVRVYVQSEVARAWKAARSSAEAATSITGGIRATNNDAAGNRYVILSATATTKDTTNGSLALGVAATSVGFGLGQSLAGSAAVAPNVITGTRGMVEQYFAAQGENMAVAGR